MEYLVSGSMNLEDLCDTLHIHLASEDYVTIGGYFLEVCDHLPKEQEQIQTEDGILLTVTSVSKNRIEQLRIQLPGPASQSDSH